MQTYNDTQIVKGQKSLAIQPALLKKVGRSASLFLQLLHHYQNSGKSGIEIKTKNIKGVCWVYGSHDKWAEELGASPKTVERIVKKLREEGIVSVEKHAKHHGNHTNFYTINYKALENLLGENIQTKSSRQKSRVLNSNNNININKSNKSNTNIQKIDEEKSTARTSSNPSASSVEPSKQTERPNVTARDLLDIWNEEVGIHSTKAVMTKDRARFLNAAFKFKFSYSLDQWKTYCKKIASSDFLMGKVKSTFRATLDWVLRFSVIQRIFEGAYGVKEILMKKTEPMEMKKEDEPKEAESLRTHLLKVLGPDTYRSWINPITIDCQNNRLKMLVRSQFFKNYIENQILRLLPRETKDIIDVIVVGQQDNAMMTGYGTKKPEVLHANIPVTQSKV